MVQADIMTTNVVDNIPNAAKLIHSLRHLDYDNLTAISDLIDNSIDARATGIWIDIQSSHTGDIHKIIISDNGSGMDKATLNEALKLGSNIPKDTDKDLGCYGMGLITASIAIGTKLTVITRSKDEDVVWQSEQDLERIISSNAFVKTLGLASDKSKLIWDEFVVDKQKDVAKIAKMHGTVVIIDKIDNGQWKAKDLEAKLWQHIGRVYRKFLQGKKLKIFINGLSTKAMDPIFDFEPTILHEEDINLQGGKIHILIAELKDEGPLGNRAKGINTEKQGFYVLRNDRELLAGQDFGIYVKHSALNTMRIEFSFPGSLDGILSSNFSKSKILLNQALSRKVGMIVYPFIKQIRRRKEETQALTKANLDFLSIEKLISAKSHLLKIPEGIKSPLSRTKAKNRKEKIECGIKKHGPRLDVKKTKHSKLDRLKVTFNKIKLTEKGPVYTADKERDKTIINWNIEHPFYLQVVQEHMKDLSVISPVCFLIWAFANAELIAAPSTDSMEIIENIRYDVGRNLAILLKE